MLKPRYYQKDAFDAFFEYVSENHGKNPLIVHPTAAGKSYLNAMIINKVLEWPNTRILCPTHRKELISQNFAEFTELTDRGGLFTDVGIYSAGLKKRDTRNRVLFVGIQSVWKKAWELGFFDLIIVDEAHRIKSKNMGTYRHFLGEMRKINPDVSICGLSATPYRMKSGLLTEGKDKIFDDICHEVSVKELIDPNHFRNRDNEQFLCPPISKNAINQADLKDVHIRGGEYVPGEMEEAFLKDDLVCRAVNEIKEYAINRNKLLIFTAGIKHCEDVCNKLNAVGINARFNHSKQNDNINDQNLKDFANGEFKALCNVDKYTEGFNQRDIDCIPILRATKSPGLYVQISGRGLRMHPSKKDTLILDFGGNIERHGPIDKIEIRTNKKTGKKEIHTAPQKKCPSCKNFVPLAAKECLECGYVFPDEGPNHDDKASDADILSKWKKPEEIEITDIKYGRHFKEDKPVSLRVDYYYGVFDKYSEWICIEHEGYAKNKAIAWLKKRTDLEINTVEEALEHCEYFKIPEKIIVNTNGKFPKITAYLGLHDPEVELKTEGIKQVWDNERQCWINEEDEIDF